MNFRNFVCRVAAVLLAMFFCLGACAAPLEPIWNETAFPPYDVQIYSNHATSGTLALRFENLSAAPAPEQPAKVAAWLVAGAPGRVPELRVTQATYVRVRDGYIVDEINSAPPIPGQENTTQTIARISDTGLLRQYSVSTINISLIIQAASTGAVNVDYWMMKSLSMELDLGAVPELTEEARRRAESFRKSAAFPDQPYGIASEQLLNPDIDAAFYQINSSVTYDAADRWKKQVQSAANSGAAFRLRVYEPGVYRITYESLLRTRGKTTSDSLGELASPDQWQLFRSGSPYPSLLGGDGESDTKPPVAGQRRDLLFYVPPEGLGAAPREKVFWLFAKSSDDETTSSCPRIISYDGGSADSTATAQLDLTAASSTSTLVRFDHTERIAEDYNPRIRTQAGGRWFWKMLANRKIVPLRLVLPPSFDPAAAERVELRFAYAFANFPTTLPRVDVFLNGSSDIHTTLTSSQGEAICSVPSAMLRAGGNNIAVRLVYPENVPEMHEGHEAFIERLTASWSQPLGTIAETTEPFRIETPTSTPLLISFKWGGGVTSDDPTSASALLFAAGATGDQYVLEKFPRGPNRDSSAQRSYVEMTTARGPYYVADQASAPAPQIEYVSSEELDGPPKPAHYLIVAEQAMRSALQPLIDRRTSQGLTVSFATPHSLFDHYSFGERDPQAIKSWVTRAFYEGAAPKPSYLLLAGETSDFRGDPRTLPEGANRDQVPTFAALLAEGIHGDHQYGTVAGTDHLQDVAVGRLSVATPDELTSALAKMAKYEDSDVAPAAPFAGAAARNSTAPWNRRIEYVFDDNEEFPRSVQYVLSTAQAPPGIPEKLEQAAFPYVPNMRVNGRSRSHEATAELLGRFQNGAAAMTFFGHGGPNLWSHERLLHLGDVPLLKNSPRLPFITCASCDNAWIDYPTRPVNTSIGELLVKLPTGGAIGLFGPVAGASPFEHQTLVSKLYEAICRRQIRRQGDLILYAKNQYFTETKASSLPEQYILIGDPALPLKVPKDISDLKVEPPWVDGSGSWTASVQIPAEAIDEFGKIGSARLSLRSVEKGDEIASTTVQLDSGGNSGTRKVQIGATATPPGEYWVELSTGISSASAVHVGRMDITRGLAPAKAAAPPSLQTLHEGDARIVVEQTSPSPGGTVTSGENPQFTYNVQNDDVTTFTQLSARLLSTAGTSLAEGSVSLDLLPGTRRSFSLATQSPLPAGQTTVTLELRAQSTTATPAVAVNPANAASTPVIAAAQSTATILLGRSDYAINVVPAARVEFVPDSARASSMDGLPLIARRTVLLSARVRNAGGVTARGTVLNAVLNDPTTGTEAQTINESNAVTLEPISAGEERTVEFRWENAWPPGPQKLFLSLNRSRTGSATPGMPPTPPSWIAVPEFVLGPQPNFAVENVRATPSFLRVGEKVTVSATLRGDDQVTSRGPIEVEIGLRNLPGGSSSTKKVMLPTIMGPMPFQAEVAADRPYSTAYVHVNPSKDWEESQLGDDEGEAHLDVLVPVLSAMVGAATALPLDGSLVSNMSFIPQQGYRVEGSYTSVALQTNITSESIVAGAIQVGITGNNPTDNKWEFALNRLRADATEDPGEVQLQIPAPVPTVPAEWFDVVATVTASPDPSVLRSGALVASLNGGTSSTVTFQPHGTYAVTEATLGRAQFVGGKIRVAIAPTHRTQLLVLGFALRPIAGEMVTPVYEFGGGVVGRAARLTVEGVGLKTAQIQVSVRTGALESGGSTVRWSDWKESSRTETRVERLGQLLEIRVTLLPTGAEMPMISALIITPE